MYQAENSGLISLSSRDLNAFKIVKPSTVQEAVAFLNDIDSAPVAYAGGVDLVTAFKENKKIGTLVWLKNIKELSKISITKTNLRIGALTTLDQVSNDERLVMIEGLRETFRKIANVRIRFSATIGGNLMARRTNYEMPIVLKALNAKLNFCNKNENFNLAPDSLFNSNQLFGAILTSIDIPLKDIPQIDYERSLRPLYTQATVKYQINKNKLVRVVIATEFLPPYTFEIIDGIDDYNQIFDKLPPDYSDLKLNNDYIKEIAPKILKRQIKRLAGKNE